MAHHSSFESLDIYKEAAIFCDDIIGNSRDVCSKTKSQLLRCYRRKHIDDPTYIKLKARAEKLINQLPKFINYLKNSNRRGSKFD